MLRYKTVRKRNWNRYNEELVKRGEILIDPSVLGFTEEQKQEKKTRGRPTLYPEVLIRLLLFIKFALRLPYRQTEGFARKLFGSPGIKVPDFRTLHYRFSKLKSAVGYGRRWLVESFFSVFKRWSGEYVSGVKFENIRRKIVYKAGRTNTPLMAGVVQR